MTIPGPWTGTRPSIARRRLASAVSSWSAAGLPPDCKVAFLCVRSAVSTDRASLARCRSSIKKASVVVSVPTRLRSPSAWLRICTVATSATSRAISQISMARPDLRRGGAERLGGADMRNLQARVVGGQPQVRDTCHRDHELESNLPGPQARQGNPIVEGSEQAIPVADRQDL